MSSTLPKSKKVNLKRLLSKKKIKEEEVGRVLIGYYEYCESNGQSGINVSQEQFNELLNKMEDYAYDWTYRTFVAIYDGLMDYRAEEKINEQAFVSGVSTSLVSLNEYQKSDNVINELEQAPLVLSKDQYNDIKTNIRRDLLNKKEPLKKLVLLLAYACANVPDDQIIKKSTLKAYKKELVTNQRIIDAYITKKQLGYYELPDGTRSDRTTKAQWKNALINAFKEYYGIAENLKGKKLKKLIYGLNGPIYDYKEQLAFMNKKEVIAFFEKKNIKEPIEKIKKMTDEELENAIDYMIDYDSLFDKGALQDDSSLIEELQKKPFCEFKKASVVPSNVTKFTVLEDLELITTYIDGKGQQEIKKNFKEFMRDYKDIYNSIMDFFKKYIDNISINDMLSSNELEEKGILYKSAATEISDELIIAYYCANINKTKQRRFNGVAITTNGENSTVDYSNLYYYLPTLYDQSEKRKALLLEIRKTLIDNPLKNMIAFETLLELIGKAYDIQGIKVAIKNLKGIINNIDEYNNTLYDFYKGITGPDQEKKEKRHILKSTFKPIILEDYYPSVETLNLFKQTTKQLGYGPEETHELRDLKTLVRALQQPIKGG